MLPGVWGGVVRQMRLVVGWLWPIWEECIVRDALHKLKLWTLKNVTATIWVGVIEAIFFRLGGALSLSRDSGVCSVLIVAYVVCTRAICALL